MPLSDSGTIESLATSALRQRYHDLHQRYGNRVVGRIRESLSAEEIQHIPFDQLLCFLEDRAESARSAYMALARNPLDEDGPAQERAACMDALYQQWREAESLARLIGIAESLQERRNGSGA